MNSVDIYLATKSMQAATWIMVCVAFISLMVAVTSLRILCLSKKEKAKKYFEERVRSLICLIHEIDYDIDFCKELIKNEKYYLKEEKVPFDDMVLINFKKVLSSNYILNDSLLEEVFQAYGFLKSMNNFLSRARIMGESTATADIKQTINILEEKNNKISNLNRLIRLKERIEKYKEYLKRKL